MKRFTVDAKHNASLCLTSEEQSPLGKLLYNLYYSTSGYELVTLAARSVGMPHTGGRHTLTVYDTLPNSIAWFELLTERFKHVGLVQPDLVAIKAEITQTLKALK